jgi:uncharacterized protein YcbK (DUF882 family)
VAQSRPAASMAHASEQSAPSGSAGGVGMEPPPDMFDAQVVDLDFWVKPRTIEVVRPASGERAKCCTGRMARSSNRPTRNLCHMLRDVNGKASMPIDPKLFETLWGTQAFVARYGLDTPIEILSGYRTPASNRNLREQGVPAARQSLHMSGKAPTSASPA